MADTLEKISLGLGLVTIITGSFAFGFLLKGYLNSDKKGILEYLTPQSSIQEQYDPLTDPEFQKWVTQQRRLIYYRD